MTFNITNNNALIQNSNKMKRRRHTTCGTICLVSFLVLGILLISLGITLFIYFEQLYDLLLTKAMTFDRESEPFRVWKTNDPPLIMDIYLFNWTNPEELRNPNIKPKFEEIGPYRFKEIKEKINITWHDNNDTISYRHRKLYFFDAENSARQLDDTITTINAVPLTIAYKARDFSYFPKRSISLTLSSASRLYVTKTAGELLFDGYEDSILSVLSAVPLTGVMDKFGLFYKKNNTVGDDGIFSMYTKTDANFGKIVSWNGRNESTFYEGACNAVRGSAGEFHPINRRRNTNLELFSSELCKFAQLEYEKDVDIKGVLGYKFTGKNIFDNGTMRPENRCFCVGECQPSGIFNVSSCRQGSPTFLSMPHFYNADPYYINAVEGIKPEEKHEFYVTLEPKSGIVIDIGARMQVNMLLQPIDYITMYEDVPRIYIPIFYFDQNIRVTDELASTLRLIQSLPDISQKGELILVTLGVMSIIGVLVYIIMSFCDKNKDIDEEFKIPQNIIESVPLQSCK